MMCEVITNGFSKNDFKAELVRKGLTSKELAKMLNLNETTLNRKVSNNGSFTRDEMVKLFEIFGKDTALNFLFK